MAIQNMNPTIESTLPAKSATIQTNVPEFGAGRYSKVMTFAFNQAINLFGATPKCAEYIARAVARQVGEILKNEKVNADLKIGKANKDGFISVAEVAKVGAKGIKSTPELSLFHAMQWWQDAGKHGYSYANTKLVLDETNAGHLADLETKANEVE